jgi:hypothetical protein
MLNRLQAVDSQTWNPDIRTHADEAADSLLAHVREYDPLTFPEVVAALPPACRSPGRHALVLQGRPGVVLWAGLSSRGAELLCQLFNERDLWLQICTPALYRRTQSPGSRFMTVTSIPVDLPESCWIPCTIGTTGEVGLNSEWSICARELR